MAIEDMQRAPRCVAMAKTTGAQCRRPAMRGSTRCRRHLGLDPEKYKAERELRERSMKLGARLFAQGEIEFGDPLTELLSLARKQKGMLVAIEKIVSDLDKLRYQAGAGEQLYAEIALFERFQDRLQRSLQLLVSLGLEKRLVEVETEKVAMIQVAVIAMLDRIGVIGSDRENAIVILMSELKKADAERQLRELGDG